MRLFVALFLLFLGGCETVVYQNPPPAVVQAAYYYPENCPVVECAVPVYPSYGSYWITADGYRIPSYATVLFMPVWRSPPHWEWHRRRWERYRHNYGYGYDRPRPRHRHYW